MYFSDTLEEESRGFQTFSFSVVFRFTHPRRTAPRALPYLERREGNPREKNTGNVGRKPRKRGAKGAGHTGGGAKGPLWNLGEPRKRIARLAAMAPAPSSQPPVVAETSPQETGSPPPPLTPPARRRRQRWRQRLSLPLRHLHPGLFSGRRRWRGGGTVVVDARPCLREGEFPPRRRGRPRLQPLNSAAERRLGAPRMCAIADRVGAGARPPPQPPTAPGKGRHGPQVERGGERDASARSGS